MSVCYLHCIEIRSRKNAQGFDGIGQGCQFSVILRNSVDSLCSVTMFSGAVDVFVCCCFIEDLGVLRKVQLILSCGVGILDRNKS